MSTPLKGQEQDTAVAANSFAVAVFNSFPGKDAYKQCKSSMVELNHHEPQLHSAPGQPHQPVLQQQLHPSFCTQQTTANAQEFSTCAIVAPRRPACFGMDANDFPIPSLRRRDIREKRGKVASLRVGCVTDSADTTLTPQEHPYVRSR